MIDSGRKDKVFKDLMLISKEEWVDLKNLNRNKEVVVNGETVKYLGMGGNITVNSMYSISFSLTTNQYEIIAEYNKTCSLMGLDFYFHILDTVSMRDILRYQDISIKKI